MATLEMSSEDLKTLQNAIPSGVVVMRPTHVAVLRDGGYVVIPKGGMVDHILFSFEVEIPCVGCSEDFAPKVGSGPSTVYVQDQPFSHFDMRKRIMVEGNRYRIQLAHVDDNEMGGPMIPYVLLVALEVPGAEGSVSHRMAEVPLMAGRVLHELEERGYRQEWVR